MSNEAETTTTRYARAIAVRRDSGGTYQIHPDAEPEDWGEVVSEYLEDPF